MDTPTAPNTSFSHQAAKLSWACPIIILVLGMLSRQAGVRVIIEIASLAIIVAGLLCGIIALFGIRTHGKRGILAPAIVGILINGALLFIFVTNFLTARAKAQQRRVDVQSRMVETGQV